MISPKKSLGQNFLIDNNIINKIINSASLEGKHILEIGPGTGSLTTEILKKNPKQLILIEKDKHLCELLEEKFKKDKRIVIYNKDILLLDVEKIMNKNTIIFGNLPYNISTQILVKLIKLNKWPPKYSCLILMFQKEVAQRINAGCNSREYGRISIITQYRLEILNHFIVSKNCFSPKPKVESSVLVFKPILKPSVEIKDLKNLEKITQVFFSNRRKMINKGLIKLFGENEIISKKLELNLSKRPSEIKKELYYEITKYFETTIDFL